MSTSERENTYTGVYPHIYEVTNFPQQNLVLLHENSNQDTYNILAFKIREAIRRRERVTNAPTIADGATVGFGYFGENGHSQDVSDPGEDVFRIDTNRENTIVEYGFGIDANGVFVGVQTGEGDAVNGLDPSDDRDRGYDAEDLPTRGGVLSDLTTVATQDTTIEEPTTALSEKPDQGLVRIDSKQNGTNPFRFAFNNQSGGSVTPTVIGTGMKYIVEPVTNRDRAMRMLRGDVPRRLITFGGLGNTNPNLPRNWYNYRFKVGPGQTSR